MKKIIALFALSACLVGCDDLFEPAIENNLGLEYMYGNSQYAEGILSNAYTRIPNNGYSFNEVATDDAVSNDAANSWRLISAGTWRSDNNPAERWRDCRAAIHYINLFLAEADKVHWADDEMVAKMFCDRMKAEAYGLRAMYMYFLLQAHAGWTADGELLGVPVITEPEDVASNFNYPRNTFAECMKALKDDAAKALEVLPYEYGNAEALQKLASRYSGATSGQVNRVFSTNFIGRMSGRIVEAIVAQADLLAASPAYNEGSGVTWEQAAKSAATVLDKIGGIAGMDPTGWTWYCNTSDIANMSNVNTPKEILWRGERSNSRSLEQENFPPTLYGNGRVNPTQNLVDAFPMVNGYPIGDDQSGYDATNPYEGRDPRLATYVLFNGGTAGNANKVITTTADGETNDALNKVVGKSTRTGYYLRKLLRQDVSLDPSASQDQYHYTPRIRYTEIFLAYAEAANEAWGPTGKGNYDYSAYDVIKAIRSRAGLGLGGYDGYLESAKASKDLMRELIRNERRLELCFEGFRFWDLRRWKADLKETAQGISITEVEGVLTYNELDVETREFQDYMYYGPIPYSEVLKFSELEQNKGW